MAKEPLRVHLLSSSLRGLASCTVSDLRVALSRRRACDGGVDALLGGDVVPSRVFGGLDARFSPVIDGEVSLCLSDDGSRTGPPRRARRI
eukprot:gene10673-66296_t